jgi:hypothetical protein
MITPFILQPERYELTFDFRKDVQYVVDQMICLGVFHEESIHFLVSEIKQIINIYKAEAYDGHVYRKIEKFQFFIQILNYGVNFQFVVMLRFNGLETSIYRKL